MGQKTFFAELTAELERRARVARETAISEIPDPWDDEVNESLSVRGGISNPHAGYGQMGDMVQGL